MDICFSKPISGFIYLNSLTGECFGLENNDLSISYFMKQDLGVAKAHTTVRLREACF